MTTRDDHGGSRFSGARGAAQTVSAWSALAFRPARPGTPARQLALSAVQCLALSAVFLVAVPLALRRAERAAGVPELHPGVRAASSVAGTVVLTAASALNATSAATMAFHGDGTPLPLATARHLVIRGPYRWVRNPMAIGGIGQGIGVGLLLGSPAVVGYALAGAGLWQVAFRAPEEADMAARFGDAYARYRDQVRCWIPRRRPVPPT